MSKAVHAIVPIQPKGRLLRPITSLLTRQVKRTHSRVERYIIMRCPPCLAIVSARVTFLPRIGGACVGEMTHFRRCQVRPHCLGLNYHGAIARVPYATKRGFVQTRSRLGLSSFPMGASFHGVRLPLVGNLRIAKRNSFRRLLPR